MPTQPAPGRADRRTGRAERALPVAGHRPRLGRGEAARGRLRVRRRPLLPAALGARVRHRRGPLLRRETAQTRREAWAKSKNSYGTRAYKTSEIGRAHV